ncbi:MAG: invasion associated locus B family protein [Pseudomonadota bacterium]
MRRSWFGAVKCLAVVTAGVVALTVPALAQTKSAPKQSAAAPKPGWVVNCANSGTGLVCRAVQTLVVRKTRQRLLGASVQRDPSGKATTLLLSLPHGLYLPSGLSIQVDKGKATNLVVQTCDVKGCYAGTALSNALVKQMIGGKAMAVTFSNLKKKKIAVNMPLDGFGAAYKKLNSD